MPATATMRQTTAKRSSHVASVLSLIHIFKISADRTYAEAVGRWTVPDPIAPAKVMGVELQTEGRAQSINMATQ